MKARSVALALSLILLTQAPTSNAALLYESAVLGQSGITVEQLLSEEVAGSSLAPNLFLGVRFEVSRPASISRLGGHFIGFGLGGTSVGERGKIFGAVIALDDHADFPNSFDLRTPDVKGTTVIELPETSGDVFGELDLVLDPGWYALIFGGSLFGADVELGIGAALRNNQELGDPLYLYRSNNVPDPGWANLWPNFRDHRFVVEGVFIPEPATLVLVACPALVLSCRRRR